MNQSGGRSFHTTARHADVQRAQAVLEMYAPLALRRGRTGYVDVVFDVSTQKQPPRQKTACEIASTPDGTMSLPRDSALKRDVL